MPPATTAAFLHEPDSQVRTSASRPLASASPLTADFACCGQNGRPLRASSSIACGNAQVQGRRRGRSKTDMALPPGREKLPVDDSGWRWAISPSLPRVGGLNFRGRPATSQPWKMDMGSINFPVASMFGTLSDVVGAKSGLALNRQQLAELLGRDDRFQEFQALSDDGWVRIHSSLAEEMVELLLFSVGRLERINNPLPIASLVHRYKKRPAKLRSSMLCRRNFWIFSRRHCQIQI